METDERDQCWMRVGANGAGISHKYRQTCNLAAWRGSVAPDPSQRLPCNLEGEGAQRLVRVVTLCRERRVSAVW